MLFGRALASSNTNANLQPASEEHAAGGGAAGWVESVPEFLRPFTTADAAGQWIALGLGAVLVLLALWLLGGWWRSRPGYFARRQRRERKVAPRRRRGVEAHGASRADLGHASMAPPSAAPTPSVSREEGARMRSPRTRTYLSVLKALSQQAQSTRGLEIPKRLFDLANVLEQHTISSLQDLSPFAEHADRLLYFSAQIRPIANSNGVAIRFFDRNVIVSEAEGPYRRETALRFIEMAEGLQADVREWLDSVRVLLPATAVDIGSIPSYDEPASDGYADAAGAVAHRPGEHSIDVSDLRSDANRQRGLAYDQFDAHAQTWSTDPGQTDGRDPLRPTNATAAPVGDAFEPLLPRRSEPPAAPSSDPAPAAPPSDPVPAARSDPQPDLKHGDRPRPSSRGLPQRLVRALEGLAEVRAELEVEPPPTIQSRERFFKSETMDRTSLLDRLDRLVFTAFDSSQFAPEEHDDARVTLALAWLREEQDELIDILWQRFGMQEHHAQIGEPFEPTHHVATDTEATAEHSRDRTVARTHSHGYTLELGRERRFLLRPKVTIFVVETAASQRADDDVASPRREAVHAEGTLDVPVDSIYPGERDFSLTVYARWRVGSDLRAWIEVDGRRATFTRAEVVEANAAQSTVHLSGCDVPTDIRRGDGNLVLEDRTNGCTARHPFEVIT